MLTVVALVIKSPPPGMTRPYTQEKKRLKSVISLVYVQNWGLHNRARKQERPFLL